MASHNQTRANPRLPRLDFILLPILGLAFFALQMDRGNISNALTSTITTDLGIDTNQINVGSALLSAGIVLLEIPSNIREWPFTTGSPTRVSRRE